MDLDISSRNADNYIEINGKPVKMVTHVDSSGNLTNPATSDNQTNGNQQTKIKETVPTDSTKNNSSIALSYDGSGNLQYIDETIGTDVYRTTLTYNGSNVLIGVSSAVKL